MAKESRTDRVYKLIEQRSNKLLGKMDIELKGMKPYAQEPVKPMDRLRAFDMMAEDDRTQFVYQYGPAAWLQLMDEMDKIRRKHRR